MSATSVLNSTQLTFTTNGVNIGCRATASANTLTFVGDSSAAVNIKGVATPSADNDAANKSYVDNLLNGLKWIEPVVAATTGNGILATDFENGDVIDGISLSTGDRVLIKNQTTASENGIYIVNASGAPTRATDLSSGADASSSAVFIQQGTTNGDVGFVCTNDSGSAVVGTDNLAFVQFTSSGVATPGGSDTQLQFNSSGSFAGVATITTDGTDLSISGGDLTIADSNNIILGAGSDLTITHNGTNNLFTSATGDLIIDNTNATGSTIHQLGTDTSATDFQVQNDTGTALLTVNGSGQVDILGNLDVSGGVNIDADGQFLTLGASSDLTLTHDGVDNVINSQTGDLYITSSAGDFFINNLNSGDIVIDNATATGSTINRLGTSTSATDFQVQNSGSTALLTVNGTGQVDIPTATASTSTSTGTLIVGGGVGVAGDIHATSFNATSDATLKTGFNSLSNPLRAVNQMNGYTYNWKNQQQSQKLQSGLLAQELAQIPELSHLVNDGDHMSINYIGIIPYLVEAIKELNSKINN